MRVLISVVICLHMFFQLRQGVVLNDNHPRPLPGEKEEYDGWSDELTKRLKKHECQAGLVNKDTTLLHGLKAGTFKELGRVKDVEVCVLQCCETHRCELALFVNNYCYGITCYSQQHCKTVPAIGNKGKTIAVFMYKTSKVNNTTHLNHISNQSNAGRSSKKTNEKFVFYPVDTEDSKDLAFSVNLRKIAKHYTENEKVRKVLTQKADEHLTEKRNKVMGGENSTLNRFLSQDGVGEANRRHGVNPGKQTKPKSHPKENNVNDIEWDPRLLKAAISSSSVAIIVVAIVLLAMSKKKSKDSGQ